MIYTRKLLVGLMMLVPVLTMGQQVKSLQFMKEIHDFAEVDLNGGPVVYQFDFTNVSDRPIRILNVRPSCGCTTPDWSKDAVEPGKSGFIQASFNPKGRPGFFNKSLTITTDYDNNPIILQIKGNVTAGAAAPSATDFRASKGNLRLKVSSFNMGKVLVKDEFVAKEFPVMNGGDQPMQFKGAETPAYIKAEMIPATVKPGEAAKVRISYNGKLKGKYGFQSDNILLHTDDVSDPDKSFSIYATLEEFFPTLSADALAKAPQLNLPEPSVDFGIIKANATSSRKITLMNTGKTELQIREVQSNCACVQTNIESKTIKPGASTSLSIDFNPQNRQGTQQKRITIYSNDPVHPVQAIVLAAQVN